MRRRLFIIFLVGISCAFSAQAQSGPDNDANGAPGYTKSTFDHGQIDSVNLYNGQLTIPLTLGGSYPIGPKLRVQVTMSYNSRVTEFGGPNGGWQSPDYTYTPLVGNPSLGIGWQLTMGSIQPCKHGHILGYCYSGADGSQHMFDQGPRTGDGSQLFLTGNGPFDMWDGDGNHYVFGWQVLGYDDVGLPEGYTHDFGRGRDGWYLTSVTDPFGNGYSISYYDRATVPTPLWTYSVPTCQTPVLMRNPPATNTWIPKDITLPSARKIHFNTGTVNGITGMITSVDFPEFVGGAPVSRTWTLVYDTFFVTGNICGTVNLQRLKTLQLPSDLPGAPSYQFSQTDLLNQITLPTGGSIAYCYANYTLYHARAGAFEPGCQGFLPNTVDAFVEQTPSCSVSSPTPGPPKPKIPGGCTADNPETYTDRPTGVVRRRETVGPTQSDTNYVQYAFPFGEGGIRTSPRPSQSLTVVISPPSDENGGTGRRRAKAVLFDSAPTTFIGSGPAPLSVPGDRVGEDVEERSFEADPTLGALADPPCSGNPSTDSDFCGSKALRVTQKAYEYDAATDGIKGGDRRVIHEKTIYGSSVCGSCPYHQVDFTVVPPNTWEINGRHFDKESHSGNPSAPLGADDRTITTTWTPTNWPTSSGGTVLPNLFAKRIEHDSTFEVDRYFYFDSSNGFLKGSAIWESTVSPTRLFLTCQYQDTMSPNGTVRNQVTLMVLNQPEPVSNVCFSGISSWTTIGQSQDLFARQFSYQNGLLTTAQWMTTATSTASWYLKRYDRDSTTGWVTRSYDTAGVSTAYLYDSLGRPTCLEPSIPPGTSATTNCSQPVGAEAVISVSYPTTTQTVATRNAGIGLATSQEYDYDGLGRLIREQRLMPGSQQAKRFYAYDPAGHQVFQSDWVPNTASETLTFNSGASCAFSTGNFNTARPTSASGTYSLCFDPFGRAQQVVGSSFSSLTTVDRTNGPTWYSDTQEAISTHCIGGPAQDTCTSPGILSTTTNAKDAFGRLTSVMEPDGNTTSYTYDINGKLTHVFQGSQTRTFVYDAGGNLRQETTPERGQVSYNDLPGVLAYGSLGNPLRETVADGVLRLRCYDFAGRLFLLRTSEDGEPNCNVVTGQSGRTYLQNSYDELQSSANLSAGKLTTSVGTSYQVLPSPPTTTQYGTVTDSWTYGGLGGRLSSQQTGVVAAQSLTATQGWQYNDLGLLAHHSHPRPDGQTLFVVSLDYDAGLPTTEYVNGIPMVTAVGYQPSGALASYTTGAGIQNVTTTITPDGSLPRPSNISTSGASANFQTGLYGYDGAGNILKMDPDTFAYDSRSRLTGATLAGTGSQTFAYDQYGNMIAKNGPPWNVTFCSPTCSNNKLPFAAADYDPRGNLTLNKLDGGEIYTWDGLDRMSYNHSPINSSYVYDGANERVAKNSGAGWSFTFRDEQKRLATVFAASGLPDTDNVYLGSQLVASYAPAGTRAWAFYSDDHLGTPRLLTDLTGFSFETRKYWPYGESVLSASGLEPLRFAGMERDDESGARYYDHARSHEANLSRFLSPDEVEGKPGAPQTWNRYGYSEDNPLKLVDPDGKEPHVIATLIGAGLGGGFQLYKNLSTGQKWNKGLLGATVKGGLVGLAVSLGAVHLAAGELGAGTALTRIAISGTVSAVATGIEKKIQGAGPNETGQAMLSAGLASSLATTVGLGGVAMVGAEGAEISQAGMTVLNAATTVIGKEARELIDVLGTGVDDAAKKKDQEQKAKPQQCTGGIDNPQARTNCK